ncbi:g11677 [Coccomyxa elongata]
MATIDLQLNRTFTNNVFSSWRFGSDPAPSLLAETNNPGSVRRSLSLYSYESIVGFKHVAVLGAAEEFDASREVFIPYLECSLAAVQMQHDKGKTEGLSNILVASTGHGDMMLVVDPQRDTSVAIPVSMGKAGDQLQPFVVEAAYHVLPGLMRVMLWTLQDKRERRPASCMLYLATIGYDLHTKTAQVEALHSLGQSRLPPHAVVVSANHDSVAIAIDPADPHTAAETSAGLGTEAAMDVDDDVPSPRTLRAAAERLAQYTSEAEEPSAGAHDHFADLYSEASPADEATTLEADCMVRSYTCRPAARIEPATPSKEDSQMDAATAGESVPSAQQEALNAQPHLLKEVSCSPYKLLTSQADGIERHAALLGLIDDVDCAVVSVSWHRNESQEAVVEHLTSIPALAYVATGKTQRKFVLLGKAGQKVAAVIVEANKFAFIYHSVASSIANGTHQVLDLGLARNDNVIGAALQSHKDTCDTSLLIMTERCLKVFNLH